MRLLTSCVVLLILVTSGCGGGTEDEQAAASKNAIDPSPFREQITAVEDLLYQTSPPELEDYGRISVAMSELHKRLALQVKNPVAEVSINDLLFLASRADMTDVGYALPELEPIRRDWQDIRDELFAPADWFKEGGPEIAAAQAQPVPEVAPQTVAALRDAIDRLHGLIDSGRREAARLGEPQYGDPQYIGPDGRAQVAAWHEWSPRWIREIDAAARQVPPRPDMDADQRVVMAHQHVGEAVNALRQVPIGVGDWPTPFEYQWEQRFSNAEGHLKEASRYLEALNR